MDISLQLSMLLWISLDFYGNPCIDLLWVLDSGLIAQLCLRRDFAFRPRADSEDGIGLQKNPVRRERLGQDFANVLGVKQPFARRKRLTGVHPDLIKPQGHCYD